MVGKDDYPRTIDLMFSIGGHSPCLVYASNEVRLFTAADIILFSTGEKTVRTSKGIDYKLTGAIAKSFANRRALVNVPDDARMDEEGHVLVRHLTYSRKDPGRDVLGIRLGRFGD